MLSLLTFLSIIYKMEYNLIYIPLDNHIQHVSKTTKSRGNSRFVSCAAVDWWPKDRFCNRHTLEVTLSFHRPLHRLGYKVNNAQHSVIYYQDGGSP